MPITVSRDPADQERPRPALPVSYDRASWRESAACREVDSEIFFPIGRTGFAVAEIKRAKAVCADCPVRQPCLRFALDTHQEYGIWGGYDEDDRRRLRRQLGEARTAVTP